MTPALFAAIVAELHALCLAVESVETYRPADGGPSAVSGSIVIRASGATGDAVSLLADHWRGESVICWRRWVRIGAMMSWGSRSYDTAREAITNSGLI